MKVHEVIGALQDYPPDMDVYCMQEYSSWDYNEEDGSFEDITCSEGTVLVVEPFTAPDGYPAVKIC